MRGIRDRYKGKSLDENRHETRMETREEEKTRGEGRGGGLTTMSNG